MYVNVDEVQPIIEGFCYTNESGRVEKVNVKSGGVTIQDSIDNKVVIYGTDIPKLIRALQEAEKYINSRGN